MSSPNINPSQPFLSISEEKFQEVCCDILEKEEHIATCTVYGNRGQSQYGIDLLARLKSGDGIEVGQCKRYKQFRTSNIVEASDKFFEHWEYWSKQNVQRFILFLACSLIRTQEQEEVNRQIERFKKFGVEYVVWPENTIINKLRPHPGIISSHFPKAHLFVDSICGTSSQILTFNDNQRIAVVEIALVNQLEKLTAIVSQEIENKLELMRKSWREGRKGDAIKWIDEIKKDKEQWSIISSEVKAKLLRFEAALEIELNGNLSLAAKLADEALSVFPADNQAKLRALIANFNNKSEEALSILSSQIDIDAVNLRAAILLEIYNYEQCEKELNVEKQGLVPNAETYRVRAIFNFSRKNLIQAQLDIQKAQELEPKWEAIRFTRAAIDYYNALSAAVVDDNIVSWPEPVDWVFVKSDEESVARLRNAAMLFNEILAEAGEENKRKQFIESWYLACLANDPEKQAEALRYCGELIINNPKHYQAIVWSIARNFKLELRTSEKYIKEDIKAKKATVPEILALCSYYLSQKRTGKVLDTLKEVKPLFYEQKADTLWLLWYTQSLVIKGKPEKALSIIDSQAFNKDLQSIRTMALRQIARKNNNWQLLIEHLEDCYKRTDDSKFLFELSQLMVHLKNWLYIIQRAEEILKRIETEEVLRIVVFAAYNLKKFSLCLKILDSNKHLLRRNSLSGELKRLRIHCLHSLGILPEAVSEAEFLAHEDPSTENLLNLAQVYYSLGDLKNVAITARKLDEKIDLTFEQAFRIANFIQWEDKELAKNFWRKAAATAPNEALGALMELGFKLELENELVPIISKMSELGQKDMGGIRLATLDNLIEIGKQWQTNQDRLSSFYRKGVIPIHFIAEQGNIPLIDIYHNNLIENEKSPAPLKQFILFARHGGRELNPGFDSKSTSKWRLNLDITALLLASHLEILDKVEQAFAPIRIPKYVIQSLIIMRDNITPKQPARNKALQQVIELQKSGKLKISTAGLPSDYSNSGLVEELGQTWVALFEDARNNEGYLVDYLPLRKLGSLNLASAVSPEYMKRIINCRSVIESLRQNGPLSAKDYETIIKKLGDISARKDDTDIPTAGSRLYLHGNISEVLSDAQVLHIVCERFTTYIDKEALQQIQDELKVYALRSLTEQTIGCLLERLRQGLVNGTYTFIPQVTITAEDANLNDDPNSLCLGTLLSFAPGENDYIWSDDRAINGYTQRDRVPIIGINEVLKALVAKGALSEAEYYKHVSRLRAANVRFIPVLEEEISFNLNQSQLVGSSIVETQDLSILRRYIAACISQEDVLQRPPFTGDIPYPNAYGELYFILGLARLITTALIDLWSMEIDEEAKIARSEWIIENLYIGQLWLADINTKLGRDESYFVSITLSGLLVKAISMKPIKDIEHSNRHKYFEWLFSRVLKKRFEADPFLLYSVVDFIKKNLFASQRRTSQKHKRAETIILRLFFYDLPEPIQMELSHDTDLMASLGFSPIRTITLDGDKYEADNFWSAVAGAVKGETSEVNLLNSSEKIIIQASKDGESKPIIGISKSSTGVTKNFVHEFLGVLSKSIMERETTLRKNKQWFDCPSDTFEHNVAYIVSIEEPAQRVKEIESWCKSSMQVYYAELQNQLNKHHGFEYADLIPKSCEGLLRHFRLSRDIGPGEEFQEVLNAAAKCVIADENIREAIVRFAGFPTPLPISIVTAFGNLQIGEKRALLRELFRLPGSPVSRIHILYLVIHHCKEIAAYKRLANRLCMKLVSKEADIENDTFLSILKWVNDELLQLPGIKDCSAQVKLALIWNHAHRLFSIFMSVGAPLDWAKERFATRQHIPSEVFYRDSVYWSNVAHPRHVDKARLVVKGLSYGIGISSPEVVDEKLRDMIFNAIFPEEDGVRLPALSLLRDFSLATNSLNSFLGENQDEPLLALFGSEISEQYSKFALKRRAEQAINELVKGNESYWGALYLVIGDMPPYNDIEKRLKEVIMKTDFGELFKLNTLHASYALMLASVQIINLGDEELREHMKEQVVTTVKLLSEGLIGNINSKEQESGTEDNLRGVLIESALNISLRAPSSSEKAAADFAELLTKLVEIWSPIKSVSKPIVQYLCEELPIGMAKYFWPLLIRLRAE